MTFTGFLATELGTGSELNNVLVSQQYRKEKKKRTLSDFTHKAYASRWCGSGSERTEELGQHHLPHMRGSSSELSPQSWSPSHRHSNGWQMELLHWNSPGPHVRSETFWDKIYVHQMHARETETGNGIWVNNVWKWPSKMLLTLILSPHFCAESSSPWGWVVDVWT